MIGFSVGSGVAFGVLDPVASLMVSQLFRQVGAKMQLRHAQVSVNPRALTRNPSS